MTHLRSCIGTADHARQGDVILAKGPGKGSKGWIM